jgi:hypothetical protein
VVHATDGERPLEGGDRRFLAENVRERHGAGFYHCFMPAASARVILPPLACPAPWNSSVPNSPT